MSDVPSWLTEENISTAATVAKVVNNPSKPGAKTPPPPPPSSVPAYTPHKSTNDVETGSIRGSEPSASPSEFIIEEETLKDMQKWHLGLRIGYMGAAVFMSAAAALSLQNQGDIGLAFFAIYVFFFAALLCCFEFALSVSADC
jgi:hypothetical protein